MKWLWPALAVALAIAWALSTGTTSAQEPRDPLIAPAEGAAGGRFQIVGQSSWTPGTTVMLEIGFADTAPDSYRGPYYHQREVDVLRDGTWSFPISINEELLPFPLWRPGFIVVRATSGARISTNYLVYTVEGRRPAGYPPLADLGFGRERQSSTALLAATLFVAGLGALFVVSGSTRRVATSPQVANESSRDIAQR